MTDRTAPLTRPLVWHQPHPTRRMIQTMTQTRICCVGLAEVCEPGQVRGPDCNAAHNGHPIKPPSYPSGLMPEVLRAAGIDAAKAGRLPHVTAP
jgi:hypothetical protein